MFDIIFINLKGIIYFSKENIVLGMRSINMKKKVTLVTPWNRKKIKKKEINMRIVFIVENGRYLNVKFNKLTAAQN